MRVHRPTYTRDGRRRKAARWHVHFQDARGTWRRLPAFTDKSISEKLGRRLEKLASCRAVGAAPDTDMARWLEGMVPEQRAKLHAWGLLDESSRALTDPLEEHADDWHKSMLARDTNVGQADQQRGRVLKTFRGCGFVYWSDIRSGPIEQWLADRREGPQLDDEGKVVVGKLKMQTSNHYLGAVSAFCQWMRDDERAGTDPLARAKAISVTDQEEKGVFTVEQVGKLISETVRQNVRRFKMDAWSRCVLYRLAADTAQRYGALKSLTAASFINDQDGDLIMKVEALHQKNKRRYDVPLRARLAADIRKLIARVPAGQPLFNLNRGHGAQLLQADLEAAGLPTIDEEGNRLVFHSFRHTATTWLLEAGVGEQATMAITGHRTRSMLDRYGHRRRAAAKAAQAKLPEFQMTGTEPSACRMLVAPLSSGGVDSRPVAIDDHADDSENAFSGRWGGRAVEGAGLENR